MPPFYRVILFLGLFVALIAGQSCSKTSPCEIGCCSKFGFCGFGSDCMFRSAMLEHGEGRQLIYHSLREKCLREQL